MATRLGLCSSARGDRGAVRDSESDQPEGEFEEREVTQIETPQLPSDIPLTTEPSARISGHVPRISDTLMSPSRRPGESGVISTQRELPVAELGSYRMVQLLGGGGMGQVFLAEHKQLGRKVALKVLRKELSNNPEVVRRFVHEAQLVNQIKNEHIVEIHDFGEGPDGLQYFVMELLVGWDLAQAREMEGPFGLNRSLDIVRQVASALVSVHERKIIHRDLKPENIFLAEKSGRKDFVKLLDFGLAKLTEGTGSAADGTAIGTLLGTPLYMSPEQAMGLRVNWLTDIFSLGLVLHWMLFDKIPHEGASAEEIRRRRTFEPLPPLPARTSRGEPLPPAVSAVIAGCLERDPGRRIQSMGEILERLPVPPPPPLVSSPGSPAPAMPGAPRAGVSRPGQVSRPGNSKPGAASSPPVLQLRSSAIVPAKQSPLAKLPLLAIGLGAGVALLGIVVWLVLRPAPPPPVFPLPDTPTVQTPEPALQPTPQAATATAPGTPSTPTPTPTPTPNPTTPEVPKITAPPPPVAPATPPKRIAGGPGESTGHKKKPSKSSSTKHAADTQDDASSLIDPFQQQ